MPEIAFLFPGQGSQHIGMGRLLAESYQIARETFDEADEVLGVSISRLCFEGPEDELKLTENTQPALLAVSVAALRVLRNYDIKPGLVAGHSLGEYSALVAAESIPFREALQLVRKRGRYMQEAVPQGVGAMAALLKLPEEKLADVLEHAAQGEIVTAANLNSPDQVVIAGHAGAVARAMELAKEAGAKRAVPLPVSAPFHCPLMKPAQERLRPDLEQISFQDLATPLINNWKAEEVRSGEQARRGLFEQIPNPVRWTEVVRKIAAKNIKVYIEVGAGSVLSGLCRSIEPSLKGARFGEPSHLDAVRSLVG